MRPWIFIHGLFSYGKIISTIKSDMWITCVLTKVVMRAIFENKGMRGFKLSTTGCGINCIRFMTLC